MSDCSTFGGAVGGQAGDRLVGLVVADRDAADLVRRSVEAQAANRLSVLTAPDLTVAERLGIAGLRAVARLSQDRP
jgi:hypothetical protein